MDELNLFDLQVNDNENFIKSKELYFKERTFKKIDISDSEVRDKEFYKCKFISCNLFQVKFINCDFENCFFESCDLSLVIFKNSRLVDVDFAKSKAVGINWNLLKNPSKYKFEDCKIDNSSFWGLNLQGISIIGCSAKEVDFTEANLTRANFNSTDLHRSRFLNSNLASANFSDATNYSIDPMKNKLKKTIFSYPEVVALLDSFDIVIKP